MSKQYLKPFFRQSSIAQTFTINRDNEYVFRKGYFKKISVNAIYKSDKDNLFEYLNYLLDEVGYKDYIIIKEIIKELYG